MKTIKIDENINNFMNEIVNANDDIKVNLSIETGNAYDLIAISNALKKHNFRSIAKIEGICSIIPLTGADYIEMGENDLILIAPLTCASAGGKEEQVKTIELLKKTTDSVVKILYKWPEAQELFKKGEEVFLTKDDAKKLNIINFIET